MVFLLVLLLIVAALSAAGLGADTRDSADWKPSAQGARASRWS